MNYELFSVSKTRNDCKVKNCHCVKQEEMYKPANCITRRNDVHKKNFKIEE